MVENVLGCWMWVEGSEGGGWNTRSQTINIPNKTVIAFAALSSVTSGIGNQAVYILNYTYIDPSGVTKTVDFTKYDYYTLKSPKFVQIENATSVTFELGVNGQYASAIGVVIIL